MIKLKKVAIFIFLLLGIYLLPVTRICHADGSVPGPTTNSKDLLNTTLDDIAKFNPWKISNTENSTLEDAIAGIIRLLIMAAGLVAVGFIILGGYQYIMAGGNQEEGKKATQTLTSAAIGLIVVLAAWLIVNTVLYLLAGKYGGGTNQQTTEQAEQLDGGGG